MDNHDSTVSDLTTGLMWQQAESGHGMDWKAAWLQSEILTLARHADWRMPSDKELQSIVECRRAKACTDDFEMDSKIGPMRAFFIDLHAISAVFSARAKRTLLYVLTFFLITLKEFTWLDGMN